MFLTCIVCDACDGNIYTFCSVPVALIYTSVVVKSLAVAIVSNP
jgi:hypothetical protein